MSTLKTDVAARTADDEATPRRPTLYLVRVRTKNGTYSVGWDNPARVLQAIAEFHANGFGQVDVYDIEGAHIALSAIEAAARRAGGV